MSFQQKIDELTARDIDQLIAESIQSGADKPKSGYQGSVHFVPIEGRRVVVKSVANDAALLWLRRWTLQNEYLVYQKLAGVSGIAKCFGLVDGQHLLLEHIEGTEFRRLEFAENDQVHSKLLELIRQLHSHDVAHADLKRRDNIILNVQGDPYLIDFGTAIVRKAGFRPLNHYLFKVAKQLDYHGWYKNKYRDRSKPINPVDEEYYQPMALERAARWVRRTFRRPFKALRRKLASR